VSSACAVKSKLFNWYVSVVQKRVRGGGNKKAKGKILKETRKMIFDHLGLKISNICLCLHPAYCGASRLFRGNIELRMSKWKSSKWAID